MLWLLLLVLLVGSTAAGGCHPECMWQCDDPVCPAACAAVCEDPVCAMVNSTTCSLFAPVCRVSCPNVTEQCESDVCPACETVCDAPPAYCTDGEILCEATSCAWRCTAPANCPYPTCALVCEEPACVAASASRTAGGALVALMFVVALLSAAG